MPQHLIAWRESIDQATLGRIAAVQDDVLTPSGADRFLVPSEYRYLRWAGALGSDMTRAQIVTPSLDVRRYNLEVLPREDGADLFTVTNVPLFIPMRPIELVPTETIEFQAAEDGAGADLLTGLASLGLPELPAMPEGDIRVIRATGSTTLTAGTWTTVTLTLDTSLEPGMYTLVGFIPIGATVQAGRVLITGQPFRPGVPGLTAAEAAAADFNPRAFDSIMWYAMGEFPSTDIPQVQYLATAADTAQVVFLYLVRTGALQTG